MLQEPQTEIIVRDWQPGQAYQLAFVRPGDWAQSRPDLPPGATIVKVVPGLCRASAPPEPTDPPPTPEPEPIDPPTTPGELLIFDWDGPVTTAEHGFPKEQPPRANGDWTRPVNFAEGVVHFRAEIRRMPSPKTARLQLCFWQDGVALETCGAQGRLVYQGKPVVLTWATAFRAMWRKNGRRLDWTRPRFRCGVAVKNAAGKPVSDHSGWNWHGENPAEWYPLDLRFTAVAVAKDEEFSGWKHYV